LKNQLLITAALALFTCSIVGAAEPAQVMEVWPAVPPGGPTTQAAERVAVTRSPLPKKEVHNVSTPQLEIFPAPADKNTGVAVLILPGGGFNLLMMDYEGEDCATWLNSIGVTGIVLKYRVPKPATGPRYAAALQDAQRAMSLIRAKAAALKINPDKLGILGFSAGAIVSVEAESDANEHSYAAMDEIDKLSNKPDFAAIIYPGAIMENGKMFDDLRFSKSTPPTFIAMADNDKTENAVALYSALKAAGASTELHIYADGAHGFGMRPSTQPHATWTTRLNEWMISRGILPAKPE
jgi:acetyl esterase/lipase